MRWERTAQEEGGPDRGWLLPPTAAAPAIWPYSSESIAEGMTVCPALPIRSFRGRVVVGPGYIREGRGGKREVGKAEEKKNQKARARARRAKATEKRGRPTRCRAAALGFLPSHTPGWDSLEDGVHVIRPPEDHVGDAALAPPGPRPRL